MNFLRFENAAPFSLMLASRRLHHAVRSIACRPQRRCHRRIAAARALFVQPPPVVLVERTCGAGAQWKVKPSRPTSALQPCSISCARCLHSHVQAPPRESCTRRDIDFRIKYARIKRTQAFRARARLASALKTSRLLHY